MKKIKIIFAAAIFCIVNIAFSQSEYFSSVKLVPLFEPSHGGTTPSFTTRSVNYDISEVNESNGRLDLVAGVTEFQVQIVDEEVFHTYYDVNGELHINSNDSNFNTGSAFIEQYRVDHAYNQILGMVFAQLRPSAKKDVVVLRDSNISVYRNSSGSINIQLDSIHLIGANYLTPVNFNSGDSYQDVIIHYHDTLRIFESNGDGTLDPSYVSVIPFSGSIKKIIGKQITLENQPFRTINGHNASSDRDEIIIASGSNIYIYNNTTNSYSYSQTLSLPTTVYDFEVSDVNEDGYNDVIAVGGSSTLGTGFLKVFLNNKSGGINSSADFTTGSFVLLSSLISTGDFNKDGWNDIAMTSKDSIYIFENIKGTDLFSTSEVEKYYINTYPALHDTKKMIIADLTNGGGLSILISGYTDAYSAQVSNDNIIRINPAVNNTDPAPAYLFHQTQLSNGFYHPKLLLYNHGDRDFLKYKIYKKGTYTNWNWALVDSTTGDWEREV